MQLNTKAIELAFQNWVSSFSLAEFISPSLEKPWFFTEFSFLLLFGSFLILYSFLSLNKTLRISSVIAFSLFFYYKSSGVFIAIFIALILSDFVFALMIHRNTVNWVRKLMLFVSVSFTLSFLLYFKYANFFIANYNQLAFNKMEALDLFLPIGISFYTFQSMSYIIDVYRREIEPSRNVLDYAFYMTFFPHLVAGPIVRAKDFLPQISNPIKFDALLFNEGFLRISIGLLKKLLLADYLGKYVDLVHQSPGQFSAFENVISVYAYTFQIYFDFSGYSDIAIGIALLLGYRLTENFNLPYKSIRLSEFWRKWHISLSTWLRDYIYIPLGGNRKGQAPMYLFLLITMLLGGFWHGADWKFVLWGALHGLGLVFDKSLRWPFKGRWMLLKTVITAIFTFHFVAFCWIFFRAESMEFALMQIQRIGHVWQISDPANFYLARPEWSIFFLSSVVVCFAPKRWSLSLWNSMLKVPVFAWFLVLLTVLQLIVQFRDETVQPFIYFQF